MNQDNDEVSKCNEVSDFSESSDSDASEADETAVDALHGSLKKCLRTPQFTDLVIKTPEKEYKVHKVIVCAQSTVFLRMLSGDWKEANEGVVTLMDDHPTAIEAMINFMYTFNYHYKRTEELLPASFHARVYTVAEKYSVEPLQKLASHKFNKILKDELWWRAEEFISIISQVYLSTSSAAGSLRGALIEHAHNNMGRLLTEPDFLRLLQELPEFKTDISRFVSCYIAFTCPGCKVKTFILNCWSRNFCGFCGKGPFHVRA
ncbi:hypothetical protein FQN55_006660 [Onygenales sp. PD_40]|nr:hypothetical protein FQN55_006660 [Onygenales sp. PD_40]